MAVIWRNPAAALHRLRRAARGTAALEFALFAPLLLMMLVFAVELGDGVFGAMQAQNAAEAGALYVAKHGWNSAGISAAVVNATGVAGMTASPAPSEFCGCPSAGGITSRDCTLTCPDGSAASTYVQINATLAHQTLLTYPGFVSPATLTGRAIVRVN
jgi:Flp pilus assembly protein TadG